MRGRSLAALGLILQAACAASDATEPSAPAPSPSPRTIGFSDFPYEATRDAVDFAYQVISREGNLAAWLWDDGVPWPEALVGADYPRGFVTDIEQRLARRPAGHAVYVGVNAISPEHDGLAPYRGERGGEPLPPPWNGRSFDHPEVIGAYLNHCERMISVTQPRYFSYATEANLLYEFDPAEWPAFLRLAAYVYPRLKAAHPNLPIFLTLQADTFNEKRELQTAVVRELLPYTDAVAVSTYPFRGESDPTRLPEDRLRVLRDLAPGKPFMITETCWPAEDVGTPYPAYIPASDETQRLYVDRLARDADALRASFVTWSFSRDYDPFWETLDTPLRRLTLRLFRDCGLYAADGRERPGLEAWRNWLKRQPAS
jgi:hypothetical protein